VSTLTDEKSRLLASILLGAAFSDPLSDPLSDPFSDPLSASVSVDDAVGNGEAFERLPLLENARSTAALVLFILGFGNLV